MQKEPTDRQEQFVENREPGRLLNTFTYEEEGIKREAVLRYSKIDDLPGIVEVNKARWDERANLPEVPKKWQEKQNEKWKGLKKVPEITKEVIEKIRSDYRQILLERQERGSNDTLKTLEESFSDPHKPFFLVVTVDGRIAGYIEIGDTWQRPDGTPGRDPDAIWVHTISVLPEYQGKKVKKAEGQRPTSLAHELLEQGIAEARNEAVLKDRKKVAAGTHTWTPRAVSFWEGEHFDRVDLLRSEEDSFQDPYSIKMERTI